MKRYRNQKGFTLIEILVVISIIAILFVILLPQFNSAFQRTKMSGVRNDFRVFQIAGESYLSEINGQNPTRDGYNAFLDKGLNFDTGNLSTKKDPWGQSYKLVANDGKLVIQSNGLDGLTGASGSTEAQDDYILALYHAKGIADVCTFGFINNNIEPTDVVFNAAGKCGDNPV